MADTVGAAIEVKSDLSKQWREALAKLHDIRRVSRFQATAEQEIVSYADYYVPTFIVAYKGPQTLEGIYDLIGDFKRTPIPAGIFIIESGIYIGFVDGRWDEAVGAELSTFSFISRLFSALETKLERRIDFDSYAEALRTSLHTDPGSWLRVLQLGASLDVEVRLSATLSREELHDLVWSEPVRTVAARFKMSDAAFKKYCARGGVPVPPRGYWAKLAAGKAVAPMPLPKREPGGSSTVRIGKPSYQGAVDADAELAKPPPELPVFEEALDGTRAWAARRLPKVKRHAGLEPLSGGLRKLMQQEAHRTERAKTDRYLFEWEKPAFQSGFETRRLVLLNNLALGLIKAGARLEAGGRAGRSVHVVVGDTPVTLSLDHPSAKPNAQGEWLPRPGPPDTLKLVVGPSGRQAEGYRGVWQDEPGHKLEAQLTEIAIEIIVAGEAEYRAGVLRGHGWVLQRRAELGRERQRRIEEAERRARERADAEAKARRELLLAQASDWRSAQDIRGFVAEILSKASAQAPDELQSWATWALQEADELDPLKSGRLTARHPV